MFTGIVEQKGRITSVEDNTDGRRLTICPLTPMDDLKPGDSVNVSGCCLTAIALQNGSFAIEAMHETLRRSKLGSLNLGDEVNLERSLKLSDRLGGHLVAGHVDTMAEVISIEEEGFAKLVTFSLPDQYAPFFVEKGSVTVDGVSLTVVSCKDEPFSFSVGLIPFTLEITTLGQLKVGEMVNIETDLVAKYLNRWQSLGVCYAQ